MIDPYMEIRGKSRPSEPARSVDRVSTQRACSRPQNLIEFISSAGYRESTRRVAMDISEVIVKRKSVRGVKGDDVQYFNCCYPILTKYRILNY
jgi:hypothetical protein